MGYDKKKSAKNRSHLMSATDVLQSLFKNSKSPLSNEFSRWQMASDWSAVVGKTVADQSRPDRIYQRTLYIAVTHPVWIQHLQFMKKEIMNSVNQYHGQKEWVTEIKFFVDGRSEAPPWKK